MGTIKIQIVPSLMKRMIVIVLCLTPSVSPEARIQYLRWPTPIQDSFRQFGISFRHKFMNSTIKGGERDENTWKRLFMNGAGVAKARGSMVFSWSHLLNSRTYFRIDDVFVHDKIGRTDVWTMRWRITKNDCNAQVNIKVQRVSKFSVCKVWQKSLQEV